MAQVRCWQIRKGTKAPQVSAKRVCRAKHPACVVRAHQAGSADANSWLKCPRWLLDVGCGLLGSCSLVSARVCPTWCVAAHPLIHSANLEFFPKAAAVISGALRSASCAKLCTPPCGVAAGGRRHPQRHGARVRRRCAARGGGGVGVGGLFALHCDLPASGPGRGGMPCMGRFEVKKKWGVGSSIRVKCVQAWLAQLSEPAQVAFLESQGAMLIHCPPCSPSRHCSFICGEVCRRIRHAEALLVPARDQMPRLGCRAGGAWQPAATPPQQLFLPPLHPDACLSAASHGKCAHVLPRPASAERADTSVPTHLPCSACCAPLGCNRSCRLQTCRSMAAKQVGIWQLSSSSVTIPACLLLSRIARGVQLEVRVSGQPSGVWGVWRECGRRAMHALRNCPPQGGRTCCALATRVAQPSRVRWMDAMLLCQRPPRMLGGHPHSPPRMRPPTTLLPANFSLRSGQGGGQVAAGGEELRSARWGHHPLVNSYPRVLFAGWTAGPTSVRACFARRPVCWAACVAEVVGQE